MHDHHLIHPNPATPSDLQVQLATPACPESRNGQVFLPLMSIAKFLLTSEKGPEVTALSGGKCMDK